MTPPLPKVPMPKVPSEALRNPDAFARFMAILALVIAFGTFAICMSHHAGL